jgi:hypothetical protein
LIDPSAAPDKYKAFVPSGSVTGSIPSDKPAGPLTIIASVPTTLPETASSPASPRPGVPLGVYALNNQFPLADVRVLLYGEGNEPALDLTSVFGVIGADVYCDMPMMGTNADSGIGKLGEHKNWQPVNGTFEFMVTSSKVIPANAPVLVCFRWKLSQGDPRRFYDSGPTHIIERQPQSIRVAATVTKIPDSPARWSSDSTNTTERIGTYAIPLIQLVPLVDARILVIDNDGSPIADELTTVGITSLPLAWVIVVLTTLIAFVILWQIARHRLAQQLPRCNPLLSIITTRNGFASLSQFQIILWTFVVIASAAYVMALSGDLIEITTGTLVLLGISGTATVIAKAKGEATAAAPPPPLDPVQAVVTAQTATDEAKRLEDAAKLATGDDKAEADSAAGEARAIAQAAQAKAAAAAAVADARKKRAAVTDAPDDQKQAAGALAVQAENDAQQKLEVAALAEAKAKKLTRMRHPRWSDLVMEETQGRELDVTRIQMLYFTLVTAAFVLLKVITSYEIPVIPEGFLILMGISNSVYVGSKFAANPAAK